MFSTIQPVIFVLMFRYVFGGAIKVPGGIPYVDFLMPGIFVQTVVFGALGTAIGLATDLKSGLLERFRTLPMARSAVLAGRTLADLSRNVFVIVLMALESLPYRPGRANQRRSSGDDTAPGTGSKIFQPTDSRQSGPEFGPAPRSSGGAPGHRGGWKKR